MSNELTIGWQFCIVIHNSQFQESVVRCLLT